MKIEALFEAFNVRPDSTRAAALKRLALGKPVPLTEEQQTAVPYLRKRGKEVGYIIELAEGKYTLRKKAKAA
jgi:hypothetical protein